MTLNITRLWDDETQNALVRMHVMDFARVTRDDAIEPHNRTVSWPKKVRIQPEAPAGWYGDIHTMSQARTLFENGWRDGAARAAELRRELDSVIPSGTILRRVRTRSDDGDDLRIDAVLAGDWENAYDTRKLARMTSNNVISVSGGWIANAGVPHRNLIWNAVQMIVLCDALEDAGWRVELRAIDGTWQSHGYGIVTDVMVKQAEEPMRADLIAATFGHAGVYRTLGFAALHTSQKALDYALGTAFGSAGVPHKITDVARSFAEKGLIPPLSHAMPRADSLDTARNNLRAAVRQLFPQTAAA
jgi:HEPN domain-containing protein